MPFEIFDKRMTPLAKAPSVTIQKRGVISLNKAAHDLVGNAETVELLYDRDRQVMALRATDDSSPHAYSVRSGSKRGPGQAIVSATAFTAHYGINTTATRRWKPGRSIVLPVNLSRYQRTGVSSVWAWAQRLRSGSWLLVSWERLETRR